MTAKKEKAKKPETELRADNVRKMRAAMKPWLVATEKVNPDPLGFDSAPPWVERAFLEVIKVLLPSNKLPPPEEWDLETLGEFFGTVQMLGKMLTGQIPIGPEMQAGIDSLKKQSDKQPQSKTKAALEKKLGKDFAARLVLVEQGIPSLMSGVLASSHADVIKFQKGLSRGMSQSPDNLTPTQIFERHTPSFIALAFDWRTYAECSSVAEIHRTLCGKLGEQKVGSLKTFEKYVVKKIGLKVRGRGRPAGKK